MAARLRSVGWACVFPGREARQAVRANEAIIVGAIMEQISSNKIPLFYRLLPDHYTILSMLFSSLGQMKYLLMMYI
jgi:hypothetical protein